MPTLDATVGGVSANAYVDVATADTYFDERLQATAWTSEDTDDKERALISATRRLDQESYDGEKANTAQALKWPRLWATDDDGDEWDGDEIPVIVQLACMELALAYLVADDSAEDPLRDTGLEQFDAAKIGPMDFTRDQSYQAGQLPKNVRRLLGPVLTTSDFSVRMDRA